MGRFQSQIEYLELMTPPTGNKTLLVVTSHPPEHLQTEVQAVLSKNKLQEELSIEVFDSKSFQAIQNLLKSGVIQSNH